jgi:hypothetical protein
LQFWVPRTKEFEEAVLGSLRLPFLFQEFDADAERTSLKILKGLGRFEGADDFPEQTITHILLNDELRSRLKSEHTEDAEVALIRDALVAETKARAEAEAKRVRQLQITIENQEASLTALGAEKLARDGEIDRLKTKIAEQTSRSDTATGKLPAQGAEIEKLKAKVAEEESRSTAAIQKLTAQEGEIEDLRSQLEKMEDGRKQLRSLIGYLGLLTLVICVSVLAAWRSAISLTWCVKNIGLWATRILGGTLTFEVGHLLLEWWAKGRERTRALWPFRQISRFRRWLWAFVLLAFVVGVAGNLFANRIQKKLDDGGQPAPLSAPSPKGGTP